MSSKWVFLQVTFIIIYVEMFILCSSEASPCGKLGQFDSNRGSYMRFLVKSAHFQCRLLSVHQKEFCLGAPTLNQPFVHYVPRKNFNTANKKENLHNESLLNK